MKYSIKPDFKPYVIYSTIKSALIFCILTFILSIATVFFQPLLAGLIAITMLGIFLLSFLNRIVAYKKEKYEISDKEFVRNTGSLFSDNQTELTFKNVTNITHVKPFLEYFFFKTSHIAVESAGSSSTEIYFRHVKKGDELYQKTLKQLKNEFMLSTQPKLIEKPSRTGILLDNFKNIIVGLITLLIIASSFIPAGVAIMELGDSIPRFIYIIGGLIILGILMTLFIGILLRILDQYFRKYTLTNSSAIYQEGFLTKVEKIIPFENVADINSIQTILDRIIGTTTIIISCQGQTQNISFSFVHNADHMKNFLKKQIEPFKEKRLQAKTKKVTTNITNKEQAVKKTIKKFTEQTFGMNKLRAFIGILFMIPLIIIPPMILVIPISAGIVLIKTFFTKYTIEPRKMKSTFDFIHKNEITFSADKITGVHLKINPIDSLMKTCKIHFWSIGSATPLQFGHIPIEKGREIIQELGFTKEKVKETYKPSFNPIVYGLRFLPITIITFCSLLLIPFEPIIIGIISGVLITITIMGIVWEGIHYSKAKMEDYPTYNKYTQGVVFYKETYMYDEQVKGCTIVQYPFSKTGTVIMNVAGESYTNPDNQKGAPMSHQVAMPYMNNCLTHPMVPQETKLLFETRPQLRNVWLSMIYIITIPFIPFVSFARSFVTYQVQENKTVVKKGIFYKTQKHILDTKLDYVSKGEGLFNKLSKNGNIYIQTTGSSNTEMVLYDIKEYKEIYETIQKKYKK